MVGDLMGRYLMLILGAVWEGGVWYREGCM
jgi:hypothetical protein